MSVAPLLGEALLQRSESVRAAAAVLTHVADSGPPLGRFAAQLGRAFLGAPTGTLHAFLERLLGG